MSKNRGYEEIPSSPAAQSSASIVDVPGLSVTIESDGTPIFIEAKMAVGVGTNNVVGLLYLREGSTVLDRGGLAQSTGLGVLYGPTTYLKARITPTPGVHTYKVSQASNGTASVQVTAIATEKAYIRVVRDD